MAILLIDFYGISTSLCCGVQNHLHKNGLIQAHKETTGHNNRILTIYCISLYIYSKNKYPLSRVFLMILLRYNRSSDFLRVHLNAKF